MPSQADPPRALSTGGGRERRSFPVATLASGLPLAISSLVVHGATPGPTVGIMAMVHGDEIEGLLILRELWRTLDPVTVAGTLRLVPVVNPLAFEAVSRNTPIDMLDLNRVFPGVRDGWLSEQIAFALTHDFLDSLDVLIDVHAGGTFPIVDYCYALNDVALSRAFLPQLLYTPHPLYPGTAAGYTAARGTPTTVIEIGGGYRDLEAHVARGVHGIANMLRYTKTIAGAVERREGQILMREMKVMRPRNGGLCIPNAVLQPGRRLPGGTKLADIVSPYDFTTLETMVTPYDDNIVVLARNYATRIHPGDYSFMMGNGATATALD